MNPVLVDAAFGALVIPGVLITMIGGTWLGVVLLRRGYRPTVTAVLLALIVPLVIGVSSLMSLGSAFIPMLFAWGFAGRTMSTSGGEAVGGSASEVAQGADARTV